MALRQQPPIEVQQEVEEEGVGGPGDGDEVMEEPEEQDDGYSVFQSSTCIACWVLLSCVPRLKYSLSYSLFDAYINPYLD